MTKIIIGGSPHSGKSTFMVLMKKNLVDKGIKTGLVDLDLSSPTLEWIEGEETLSQRNKRKKPWTPELAIKSNKIFNRSEKKFDVVLGDAPGKITNITKIITKGVDGAIILSRDQKETKKWNKFYKKMRVPVLCKLDSKLFGVSDFDSKKNKGTAVNMSRSVLMSGRLKSRNMATEGCSFEISERYGFNFKEPKCDEFENKLKGKCSLRRLALKHTDKK